MKIFTNVKAESNLKDMAIILGSTKIYLFQQGKPRYTSVWKADFYPCASWIQNSDNIGSQHLKKVFDLKCTIVIVIRLIR
jgi:hypothetical protein